MARGSSRPSPCGSRITRTVTAPSRTGSMDERSAEIVEDLLHVVVLLERVHQLEHLGGLRLGKLHRRARDVLRLGRDRRDAAILDRLLQAAEVGEAAADHQLRLALLALALPHLLEAVIDEVELERVGVDAGWIEPKNTHALEQVANAAVAAEV